MISRSEATLSPKPLKTFFIKKTKTVTKNKTKPNQKNKQKNLNKILTHTSTRDGRMEKKRHYTRREWLTSTTLAEAELLFPIDGMLCTAAAQ